jgi:hypothetical protein
MDFAFFALADGGHCSCDNKFGSEEELLMKTRDLNCDVKGTSLGGSWT